MLRSFATLLFFQLVGEVAVRLLRIPVPGPVVGMLMLLLVLLHRGKIPLDLHDTSLRLLENLSLLFVPAGVGVMVHFGLLTKDLLPLFVAILASTLLAVACTALTMVWLAGRGDKTDSENP